MKTNGSHSNKEEEGTKLGWLDRLRKLGRTDLDRSVFLAIVAGVFLENAVDRLYGSSTDQRFTSDQRDRAHKEARANPDVRASDNMSAQLPEEVIPDDSHKVFALYAKRWVGNRGDDGTETRSAEYLEGEWVQTKVTAVDGNDIWVMNIRNPSVYTFHGKKRPEVGEVPMDMTSFETPLFVHVGPDGHVIGISTDSAADAEITPWLPMLVSTFQFTMEKHARATLEFENTKGRYHTTYERRTHKHQKNSYTVVASRDSYVAPDSEGNVKTSAAAGNHKRLRNGDPEVANFHPRRHMKVSARLIEAGDAEPTAIVIPALDTFRPLSF